jgi:hypothetical protein
LTWTIAKYTDLSILIFFSSYIYLSYLLYALLGRCLNDYCKRRLSLIFFTRTMYYNLSASLLLLFTVIFMIGGCSLYKSRHVLKVAAKGATASARFVMKALWVRKRWLWKRLVMIMWNDKQDVKCKYKTLTVPDVHM